MNQFNISKNELEYILKNSTLNIQFKKLNDEVRTMFCTLKESFLPEIKNKNDNKNNNEDLLVVWDIDKNGWRSLRISNLISVQENTVLNCSK